MKFKPEDIIFDPGMQYVGWRFWRIDSTLEDFYQVSNLENWGFARIDIESIDRYCISIKDMNLNFLAIIYL